MIKLMILIHLKNFTISMLIKLKTQMGPFEKNKIVSYYLLCQKTKKVAGV